MNFLAAMVLLGVNFDLKLAFSIFVHLLEDSQFRLKNFYDQEMTKLQEIADSISIWLAGEEPKLMYLFEDAMLPLHTMLAGPLMSLFANVLDFSICLEILDRIILQKTHAFITILQNMLRS
jgi:hypothetical protein